nr:molybdenum cofactor biosynthesis protein MoaE [Prochloraceae cyanobacterium]
MNFEIKNFNKSTNNTNQDSLVISFAPLSIEEVYRLADNSGNGAVVLMSGTVRDRTDGRAVKYLEYQAYQPMAIEIFRSIAAFIRQNWQDTNTIVIHHRIGSLQIGEISVLVAVGCPHRGEAF